MSNIDFDKLPDSMVKILGSNGEIVGSGFIIKSDGYIITCHHVIYTLASLDIEYLGQKYTAEWCEELSNIEKDIAILKIDISSDANAIRIILPKNQNISVLVYGFPYNKVDTFSKGFDISGSLSDSPQINTKSSCKNIYTEIKQTNQWNRMPQEDSTFYAYRINEGVESGMSGGPVIDRESGGAVGVIQSTTSRESYVIKWNNINDSLEKLDLKPSENNTFTVINSPKPTNTQSKATSKLPGQQYRELLGRENDIEKIMNALKDSKGRQIVGIEGLGGMGKTALAREVAELSLNQGFQNLIWQTASTKNQSQGMTFETVLDDIAIQLNKPDLQKFKGEERNIKTRELLSNEPVLIVLDNLETSKEPQNQIADKLYSILGSSKALLTSRHRFKKIEHDIWSFRLKGLDKDAAINLIKDTAEEKNLEDALKLEEDELEPIIEVTGNTPTGYSPMALKFIVGQLDQYVPEEILKRLGNIQLAEDDEEINDTNEFRQFWKEIFITSFRLLSQLDIKFMGGMTIFEPNVGSGSNIVKATLGLTEDEFEKAYDNTWRVSFLEREIKEKRLLLHKLTFTFFSAIMNFQK